MGACRETEWVVRRRSVWKILESVQMKVGRRLLGQTIQ